MSAVTWAVVVNWNGGAENIECLRSLADEGIPAERVAFVDNASEDGSLEEVRSAFPDLAVIANDANRGFGDGCNQGIELARDQGAERVLLLNNDAVLGPGCLALLGAALDREPDLGIVGPRVLYKQDPDRIWAAGGRLTFRHNLSLLLGHQLPDGPRWRQERDVDYVCGCAMLITEAVFARIGLLDGKYFAYHEDVDFCLQATRAGIGVRTIGAAAALHSAHLATGGGYNPSRKYMMGVNTVRFLKRNGTALNWVSWFVFDVLTLPVVWAVRAPRGDGSAVWAKARGILDGLRGKCVIGPDWFESR